MKNLVLEHDLGASLALQPGERATHACLSPTEPHLFLATSDCCVVCLSLDTFKVRWVAHLRACSSRTATHARIHARTASSAHLHA